MLQSESAHPWSERISAPEMVHIGDINLYDWYPIDGKALRRYLQLYWQRLPNGQPTGIIEPVMLARLPEEKTLRVGNGFHRIATEIVAQGQRLGLIEELPEGFIFENHLERLVTCFAEKGIEISVPAQIDPLASFDSLWLMRSGALMGQHERVRWPRILQMVNNTWHLTKWGEMGISFHQAIEALVTGREIEALSQNDNQALFNHIKYIAEMWGVEPSTVRAYLRTYERLHESLWSIVRHRPERGELSQNHASALAVHFGKPALRDVQPVIAKLAMDKLVEGPEMFDKLCYHLARLYPAYLRASENPLEEFSNDFTALARRSKHGRFKLINIYESVANNFADLLTTDMFSKFPEFNRLIVSIIQKINSDNLSTAEARTLAERLRRIVFSNYAASDSSKIIEAAHKLIAETREDFVSRSTPAQAVSEFPDQEPQVRLEQDVLLKVALEMIRSVVDSEYQEKLAKEVFIALNNLEKAIENTLPTRINNQEGLNRIISTWIKHLENLLNE